MKITSTQMLDYTEDWIDLTVKHMELAIYIVGAEKLINYFNNCEKWLVLVQQGYFEE